MLRGPHSSFANYNKFFMKTKVLRNPNQLFTNLKPSLINREIMNNIIKGHPLHLNNISQNDSEELKEIKLNLLNISDQYLKSFLSVGSYTDSVGNKICLENIKRAMNKRDAITELTENKNELLALEGDSTSLMENLANVFIKNKETAVFLPNPNDPIYEIFSKHKGSVLNYNTDVKSFKGTLNNVKKEMENMSSKIKSKILFISNPDTFCGKVLNTQEIEQCLEFCYKNNVLLLVDESFQQTTKSEFKSFRKVLNEHKNKDLCHNLELISFYDPVKSLFPNACLQGAIITLTNLDQYLIDMYIKLRSVMLCSSTISQINADLNFSLYYDKSILSEKSAKFHREEINRNKKIIFSVEEKMNENLKHLSNLTLYDSDGGFSIWAKIEGSKFYDENLGDCLDFEISKKILKNTGINCQAGSSFGRPGYLRFSKIQDIQDFQFDSLRETISLFRY